jgi:hypothetical protein
MLVWGSASCPRDISSDDSSDDEMAKVQKTSDSDDVKLAALKKSKLEKISVRTTLEKDVRRAHSFNGTRKHVQRSPYKVKHHPILQPT